ncbi:ROK family protein [Nocardia sp. NPDC004722]
MTLLALEIGPARFTAAQVADDVETEDILHAPIPDRAAWECCADLLAKAAAGTEVTSLGIACTGPIDMAAGIVAPPTVAEWRSGFTLVAAARELFPGAAVHLAVDGVCLALGERHFGAAREATEALSLSISEHVIGGITVGGFAVVGRTGNAGNIGHVLVPGFDEPCACGGHGCLEAVAGGLALCRWARTQGWRGESLTDLTADAGAGDPVAVAALGRAGTALGRAIASVSALLDVDLVVLGGGVTAAGRSLWNPLGTAVAEHARLGYLPGLRVVPSKLGEVAVLAGAGFLALAGANEPPITS